MLSKDEDRKERIDTLRNDLSVREQERQRAAKQPATYHGFAVAEASEHRGRFAAINEAVVVGHAAQPSYPRLPESSPWHHDPVGPEEPLGFSVNALEPSATPAFLVEATGPASDADAPSVVVPSTNEQHGVDVGPSFPTGKDEGDEPTI
jgi:hypothetical protein